MSSLLFFGLCSGADGVSMVVQGLYHPQFVLSALPGSPPEPRCQWGFMKRCIRRAQALVVRAVVGVGSTGTV